MKLETNYNYIKNVPEEELNKYYALFKKRVECTSFKQVKYLILGNVTVKIENHVEELTTHLETQLAYCLRDDAVSYDCTFVIWKDDVKLYVSDFAQRAMGLLFYPKNSAKPAIEISLHENKLKAYSPKTQTYYFSGNDFSIDVVRKMGHLFVKQLSNIALIHNQVLVHSAAVGINNQGVLICARGGGGKSTLAISALLNGFQYVSDDYVIMRKAEDGQMYVYPIYSTINLFPSMQQQLKGLNAKVVHKSYWQPEKNTLEISAHHNQYVDKLPINTVIFPQICNIETPSIEPIDGMEKGKAIVQLIHSTIEQLQDSYEPEYIKTLTSFVQNLNFYQINLSTDLEANIKLLKQFLLNK